MQVAADELNRSASRQMRRLLPTMLVYPPGSPAATASLCRRILGAVSDMYISSLI